MTTSSTEHQRYAPGQHLTVDMFQKPYTPKSLSKESLTELLHRKITLSQTADDDHAYLSKHMLHKPLTASLHQNLLDKPSVTPPKPNSHDEA